MQLWAVAVGVPARACNSSGGGSEYQVCSGKDRAVIAKGDGAGAHALARQRV